MTEPPGAVKFVQNQKVVNLQIDFSIPVAIQVAYCRLWIVQLLFK